MLHFSYKLWKFLCISKSLHVVVFKFFDKGSSFQLSKEISFQNDIVFDEIITQRSWLDEFQDPFRVFELIVVVIEELYLIIFPV